MNSGIISIKTTESTFCVTANRMPPIISGASSMMYGKAWCSWRLGPAGSIRFCCSKRGTTRGERLKSISGELGAELCPVPSDTTETVVSPRATVSEEFSVARVTGSPSISRPLAEFVSTISTVSPTVMRACRLEVSGSVSRMSTSRSRPM